MLIAFSICVFPILLTTVRGLREVEPDLLDLVKTLRGSRWQIFTKIQLPGALPYIFSGMKVAAILAVAGAIVGEFLGSDKGLGYLMLQVQVTLDTAAMFMAVMLITLIGMLLYGAVLARARARGARCAGQLSAMPDEPFIHLAGVAKTYGKGAQRTSRSPTRPSTSCRASSPAWSGPSGCGKTTLLKILAGLHPHDAGTVKVGSTAVPFDPARDIGMVFQQPLLLKWRTISTTFSCRPRSSACRTRRAANGRATCSRSSASPAPRTSGRTSSRAACSSAPRSRARSSTTPSSC